MDRKKYVFEASDDVKKVMAMGVTRGGAIWTDTMDVENFEELNSDYINEHFGELQETAYQRGLNDAWEAARKIVCDDELDWNTLLHIFNRGNFDGIFGDFSPSEAIAKLKAYEEKQKADDEIKVGDVVRWKDKDINDGPALITWIGGKDGKQCNVMCDDGSSGVWNTDEFVKTGRHFDIESILEDMRE